MGYVRTKMASWVVVMNTARESNVPEWGHSRSLINNQQK